MDRAAVDGFLDKFEEMDSYIITNYCQDLGKLKYTLSKYNLIPKNKTRRKSAITNVKIRNGRMYVYIKKNKRANESVEEIDNGLLYILDKSLTIEDVNFFEERVGLEGTIPHHFPNPYSGMKLRECILKYNKNLSKEVELWIELQ